MKRMMLLAAFLVACAPSEKAATDSAAAAVGPAPLMASDVAGTWNGVSMAEGSDSIVARWTVVSPNGTDGKVLFEGTTDSVSMMHSFDADSFVATSAPYTDQMLPNKPQVTTRAVGRLIGGKLVGTATTMLVSKPDSVVARARWEATKTSP
jgi:hypothetical protein